MDTVGANTPPFPVYWLYILLNLLGGLVYALAKTGQLGETWTMSVCRTRKRNKTEGEYVSVMDVKRRGNAVDPEEGFKLVD